ncbi:hypothetical protein SRHO_G00211030 [Serrasalmus rhombeus]
MCLLLKKPATQQLQHNNMVLSGTLSAVLLCSLSLCLRGTETVDVDQNALARIISKLQKEYCPKQGDQFAVAINVPARYCSAGSNLDDGSFLKNDKPDAVKRDMNGVNKLYQGKELIGALRKSSNNKGFYHSEYLLLREPDPEHSPMKNLLNKNKDGCVIFYTYNSPCIGTTLQFTETAPSVFMILPLKTRILQSMESSEEDSTIARDVKAAIRGELNSRYADPTNLQDKVQVLISPRPCPMPKDIQ